MTRMRNSFVAISMMLGLMGCASPTPKGHVLLDDLPVSQFYSPASSTGRESYPNQQAAFVRAMRSQAEAKGYRVLDHRIFVFVGHVREIGPQWVVLRADLWTQFKNSFQAKEVANYVASGKSVAAAIWRLHDSSFISVAQSEPLPDGTALVGYFSLELIGSTPARSGSAPPRLLPPVPETRPAAL